jgi:hypothetical protein
MSTRLSANGARTAAYFSCVEIDENVLLSFVRRPLMDVTIAIEIPAASGHSVAVAAVVFDFGPSLRGRPSALAGLKSA